jgi:hypothetical protein
MSLDYILNFPSKSAGLFAPADCATSSTPAKFLEYEPRENKKRKPSLQCRTQGCAAEFSRKSQLLYHKINIHRDVPLSASGAFMCHACKFAFIRKGDLVSNYPLHRMPPIDFFHRCVSHVPWQVCLLFKYVPIGWSVCFCLEQTWSMRAPEDQATQVLLLSIRVFLSQGHADSCPLHPRKDSEVPVLEMRAKVWQEGAFSET